MNETARLSAALADRYRIERELGAGGMATVYLAHDVRHDRKVALKVLRPDLAAILGGERFLAEIKTTANLQHPHILPLHDSGTVEPASGGTGLVYYVMPYVEGESLRDRLTRERQLPVEDAVRIACEVADALDYAHQQGVVHRDIKPENILLHGGHALVADFGIALAASRSEGGTRMTETGMSLGTPHYMAPEQSMGEKDITPRADIYALGCVVYEMLTGEPPFTGPSAQAIIARVMTEHPRAITLQRHTVPATLEAVVLKALEKLPADRFETAAAFGESLRNPPPVAATSAGGLAALGPARRDWRSRVALPALGAAVVMAALAIWGWRRPAPPAPVARYRLWIDSGAAPFAEFVGGLALSPSGSDLAYIGPSDQGPYVGQLWLKRRDHEAPVRIPGTIEASSVTFSPDGQWMAFGDGVALKKMQIGGGAAIQIGDSLGTYVAPAWLDDGTLVAAGAGNAGLRRVPEDGGTVTTIWPRDSGQVRYISALPGTRGVLVARCGSGGCGGGRINDLWVVDLRRGTSRQIVAGAVAGWYLPIGAVLYVRSDGAALAIAFDLARLSPRGSPVAVLDSVMLDLGSNPLLSVSRTGTLAMLRGQAVQQQRFNLFWVDRGGREQQLDLDGPVRLTGLGNAGWALSPDGRELAISLTSETGDAIWVKHLPSGPLSRVTFDSGAVAFRPRWMPGGRAISYVSGALLHLDLRSVPSDGIGGSTVLAQNPAGLFEGAVSPDGRWIVARTAGGVGRQGRDIVGYRVGDTTMVPLIANPSVDESAFVLSPDGRWIAYESDETGRREIYVRPFPNTESGKWQASTTGGMAPLWARSGRELYFVDAARHMTAVTFTPGTPPRFGDRHALFPLTPDDYLDANTYYTPFDVAADGRFLMARRVRPEAGAAPLIVVENWFAELRQKLAQR